MWGNFRSSDSSLSLAARHMLSEARVTLGRLATSALTRLAVLAAFGAFALAAPARAEGIPAPYGAMVVQPTVNGQRHEFDLNPALERARREKKNLYVFLGAHDCPYCRRYEAFLDKNAAALVPRFKPYLVVDLRSALMVRQSMLYMKLGERALPYSEFQRNLNDERERMLVYPSVWLLDTKGKPLMQMPAGTGTFETVDEQIEILELVN